jgi:hypothetical protein
MRKFCLLIGIIIIALSLKAQVSEEEFQALKVLYNSTGGDHWSNRTGWENINTTATKDDVTTSWKGIYDIRNGHITNLNLYNNNLTGSIPDEIGVLTHLTDLVFNSNYLTGQLPQTLKQLTSLMTFGISGNNLVIPFPTDLIKSWPNLRTLSLSYCGITGTVPDIFGYTPNLNFLSISNNNLEGKLPPSLDSLYLREFHCEYNNLEGPLPLLTNTIDVYRISFDHNHFTGTIPEHYGDFVLQYFLINDNYLSGMIPEKLLANRVYFFTIQNNYFTFAGIEPIIDLMDSSDIKDYSTNKKMPLVQDTVKINEDGALTLDATALSLHTIGGSHTNYKWFFNTTEVYSGKSPVYTVPSVSLSEEGKYRFEVTDTIVPDLIIQSQDIYVKVKKVNHNPTDIFLSQSSVAENYEGLVGAFSASDPDAGDVHTYSLIKGDGNNDADNGYFTINGDQLILRDSVDYELVKTLHIMVAVFDGKGGSTIKAFAIDVTNVNEAPVFDGQVTTTSISEMEANGSIVFTLLAKDPENDPITFAIREGNDNGAFKITGKTLVVADSTKLDYETKERYVLLISASDGKTVTTITLTVNLIDVAEKYSVKVSALPEAGGTITVTPDSFVSGDSVTVKATPGEGYEFVNWTENGEEVSTTASYSFTLSSDRSLVANFQLKSFTVALTENNSVYGKTNFDSQVFDYGESVTIIAQPNSEYEFVNWTENGNVISSTTTYTFIVYEDHNLVANFQPVVGITDHEISSMNIYPNPAVDYIYLTGMDGGYTIVIINTKGVVVYQRELSTKEEKIDIGNFKKGIYLVKMSKGDKEISRKILVE